MTINDMRPLGQPDGKEEKILIHSTGGGAINGLQVAKASGAEGMFCRSPSILQKDWLMSRM